MQIEEFGFGFGFGFRLFGFTIFFLRNKRWMGKEKNFCSHITLCLFRSSLNQHKYIWYKYVFSPFLSIYKYSLLILHFI